MIQLEQQKGINQDPPRLDTLTHDLFIWCRSTLKEISTFLFSRDGQEIQVTIWTLKRTVVLSCFTIWTLAKPSLRWSSQMIPDWLLTNSPWVQRLLHVSHPFQCTVWMSWNCLSGLSPMTTNHLLTLMQWLSNGSNKLMGRLSFQNSQIIFAWNLPSFPTIDRSRILWDLLNLHTKSFDSEIDWWKSHQSHNPHLFGAFHFQDIALPVIAASTIRPLMMLLAPSPCFADGLWIDHVPSFPLAATTAKRGPDRMKIQACSCIRCKQLGIANVQSCTGAKPGPGCNQCQYFKEDGMFLPNSPADHSVQVQVC